jgi:PmbA protein
MTLSTLGRQVLDAVQKRLPAGRQGSSGVQAEAYAVTSESRTQEWSEGQPENLAISKSQGLGLRVINRGRLGFSSTNRSDIEALSGLADSAVTSAELTAADPFLELSKPCAAVSEKELELTDPSLAKGSFEERSAFLSGMEAEVKKRDKRLTKVLRASYREGRYESALMNSLGISAQSAGTSVSFSLACVAVQGSETQMGYGFQSFRHYADLKPEWVIEKTVENALSLLGGKQVPSGRYDLLFSPFVAAEMLELLSNALRGDQVLKGKSFLATHLGKEVGASCLTIVDDGRLKRGLGSSAYDAEGLPTQTTTLFQKGVLQGFLYDSTTARKAKKASTGNAGRSSYRGLPEPETTNFFIKPGMKTPEELVSGIESGIYVHNAMGLHTVDTVSGDYSLGIMGERIEKGKRTHGVRGVTIAGNLLDLLKNVEAVGNDLVFSGSLGSPTLWIRGVSVGGA